MNESEKLNMCEQNMLIRDYAKTIICWNFILLKYWNVSVGANDLRSKASTHGKQGRGAASCSWGEGGGLCIQEPG